MKLKYNSDCHIHYEVGWILWKLRSSCSTWISKLTFSRPVLTSSQSIISLIPFIDPNSCSKSTEYSYKTTESIIHIIVAFLQVWLNHTSLYSSPGYWNKWARCLHPHVSVSSNGESWWHYCRWLGHIINELGRCHEKSSSAWCESSATASSLYAKHEATALHLLPRLHSC